MSIGGKPFLDLRPIPTGTVQYLLTKLSYKILYLFSYVNFSAELTGEKEIAMSGFVFRENKFTADPGRQLFVDISTTNKQCSQIFMKQNFTNVFSAFVSKLSDFLGTKKVKQ